MDYNTISTINPTRSRSKTARWIPFASPWLPSFSYECHPDCILQLTPVLLTALTGRKPPRGDCSLTHQPLNTGTVNSWPLIVAAGDSRLPIATLAAFITERPQRRERQSSPRCRARQPAVGAPDAVLPSLTLGLCLYVAREVTHGVPYHVLTLMIVNNQGPPPRSTHHHRHARVRFSFRAVFASMFHLPHFAAVTAPYALPIAMFHLPHSLAATAP